MWKAFALTLFCGIILQTHSVFAKTNPHAKANHHLAKSRGKSVAMTPPEKAVSEIKSKTSIDIQGDQASRNEEICLALALYHEARSNDTSGQFAVGHVILNRSKKTGKTISQVLWDAHGSQFQWVKKPLAKIIPHDQASWFIAQHNAVYLMTEHPEDNTNGATMFFNPTLASPPWAKYGEITARYGGNVFIRMGR